MSAIVKPGIKTFMETLWAGEGSMVGSFMLDFILLTWWYQRKVAMVTRHNNDKQYAWEILAESFFTIHAEHSDCIDWNTKVLHLKDQREHLK